MAQDHKSVAHVEHIISLMGKKHMLMIIYTIRTQPKGFNEIQEALSVNTATLSSRLRELREHNIIEMHVCPRDSRQHYYGLTERGRKIGGVLKLLINI